MQVECEMLGKLGELICKRTYTFSEKVTIIKGINYAIYDKCDTYLRILVDGKYIIPFYYKSCDELYNKMNMYCVCDYFYKDEEIRKNKLKTIL